MGRRMNEHFTKQIEEQQGDQEMYFYGLERQEPFTISIMRHRGSLDTFPTDLEYVRHLTDGMPCFKETE